METADLKNEFINTEVIDRILACSLAELAVRLALQAGEEVSRPLSFAQLTRAFQVNTEEFLRLRELLDAHWKIQIEQGKMPAEAFLQRTSLPHA